MMDTISSWLTPAGFAAYVTLLRYWDRWRSAKGNGDVVPSAVIRVVRHNEERIAELEYSIESHEESLRKLTKRIAAVERGDV